MMKKTKICLAVSATLAIAGVMVAPQAAAHSKAKKHHHTSTTTYSSYSSSSSVSLAESANNKIEALEAQLQSMQSELQALRAESRRPVASADSAKVQELDQWMDSVKSGKASTSGSKENMVFFRGGYGHADNVRGGTIPASGVVMVDTDNDGIANTSVGKGTGANFTGKSGQDAWYFGAGFDFKLVDNLFGLMQGTDVFAELMFDYKQFDKALANSPLATTQGGVLKGYNGLATVNQLTLTASPKIKFLKGQAFRPWVIPVGFELDVISPPSDAITVLNPAMQFGLGADYRIWENLYVGADARYHYATDNIDGVNTNGVTAGGYLGIGF